MPNAKSSNKNLDQRIAPYQHATPTRKFRLGAIDPAAKPLSSGDRERDKAAVAALAERLDALQMLFYADRRYKLLVVLQGMDASGKDGTLRAVFGRMSPLGVRTVGWKAPTEEERAHDPWWRIHRAVPGAGEVVVFNRSHYEDVLVPVVIGALSREQIAQRYQQINEFERMLTEHGTLICKFMLHISKDEQRARLQERIDDPTKHWKFDLNDLEVRKRWNDYQAAYAAAISATGTPWAPWTVVPANSKTHRNLMIATLLERRLLALKLRVPPNPEFEKLRIR
jgi:PPK2 family polyphosphate:nucleotide phosphotransferase